jgi:hypothetical protein
MMLLLVLAGAVAVAAAPNPSHVLHERHQPHWSNHWSRRDAVPRDSVLPMRISLKQAPETLAKGHEFLMDVYALMFFAFLVSCTHSPSPVPGSKVVCSWV